MDPLEFTPKVALSEVSPSSDSGVRVAVVPFWCPACLACLIHREPSLWLPGWGANGSHPELAAGVRLIQQWKPQPQWPNLGHGWGHCAA